MAQIQTALSEESQNVIRKASATKGVCVYAFGNSLASVFLDWTNSQSHLISIELQPVPTYTAQNKCFISLQ